MNTFKIVVLLVATCCVLLAEQVSSQDCLYNRCEWKFLTFRNEHVPCLGTDGRALVRNVDCADGNTFHICCKLPYRSDIQTSRQKWFRVVTAVGSELSSPCTKRILCEQSCLDGLRGSVRSDYPQILDPDTDTDKDKDYVNAYTHGENLACYNLQAKLNPFMNTYSAEQCKDDCGKQYSDCENELASSLIVKAYYESSRTFHRLGLWVFTAFHITIDTFRVGVKRGTSIGQTIKHAFTDLFNRMVSLQKAYFEWLNLNSENSESRSKRSIVSTEVKWKQFLIFYKKSDTILVENLYESLSYAQFSSAIQEMNRTLVVTDFGPGQWNNANAISNWSTMLFVLICACSFMIFV